MADIKGFRGYRFALGDAEDLGNFCAPPYDMLDDAMIEQLYAKHPHNTVRITQNRREDVDAANKDRHVRAARFMQEWIDGKIIMQDDSDSVYIYKQQFTVIQNGMPVNHERIGICVLVKLVEFEEQIIFPHEYTLSGPKQDRYELMETTFANTGQIFGLASDDDGNLYAFIRNIMNAASLTGTFKDTNGVIHTLYRCVDTNLIAQITELMKTRNILIADGHHRYETALRFYRNRGNESLSHVMMTLVSMADPGLVIRPFHRLIRKSDFGRLVDNMNTELARYFDVTPLGKTSAENINAALAQEAAPSPSSAEIVFWNTELNELYGLRLNSAGEKLLADAMPQRTPYWRCLDVSKINGVIVNGILKLPLDGHTLHDIVNYVNDVETGVQQLIERGSEFYGGFFIRPMSINVINETVKGGERMPQKSTNFYPKIYCGLVFNKM